VAHINHLNSRFVVLKKVYGACLTIAKLRENKMEVASYFSGGDISNELSVGRAGCSDWLGLGTIGYDVTC
jgi:hypothetical protein